MSIATELQSLNDNILSAYDAVETKGGAVPADKNTANLSDAIMSITGECEDTPVYEINSTTGMFYTDMTAPLEKLLVSFMPKQSGSGTPSPSNVRPIEGWTSVTLVHNGKNLFDKDKPLIQSKYITDDGSIGTLNAYQYSDYYTPVQPSTAYIFSGDFGSTAFNTISFYDASKNFIGRHVPPTQGTGAQFTTPSNCYYIRFNMNKAADLSTIQLEVGSTATTYEAYQSVNYEVDWGKNLWGGFASDFTKSSSGITFVTKTDGTITNTAGTTSAIAYSAFASEATSNGLTKTLEAGTYCISGAGGDIMLDVCNTSGNALATDTGSGATFTLSAQQTVFVRVRVASGKTLAAGTTKPLLESGNQPTAYEPYVGTVYGGTLDVVSGVLAVDRKFEPLNNLTSPAGLAVSWTYDSGNNAFQTSRDVTPAGTAGAETGVLSSCYDSKAYGYNGSYAAETSVIWAHPSGTLRVRDTRFTDVNSWLADVGTQTICYPLATPQTYQLTPQQINTLMGNNAVTVDGASAIELVYLSHVLPTEYQAVEYIENTSTSYINTDYSMTSDVTEQTIQFFSKPSAASSLFGAERSGAYTGVLWTTTGSVSSALFIGSTRNATTEAMQRGIWHTLTIKTTSDTDGSLTVDGYEQTFTYSDGVLKGYPIWLFNNNNASTAQYAKNRIARFQITDNGVKVRDLVACYRKADDVAGMYDIVNNVFYTNAGTGDFSVGEDI